MAWNLARFVALPGESDDFTADNAAGDYRRHSGAALPLLVALESAPSPERRDLALRSIARLETSRERAVVLSFACDAMAILKGIAQGERVSSLPASWVESQGETIAEARRLLGTKRPTMFDSVVSSIDQALAQSSRRDR
jgi:hypothetical protein